MTEINDVLSDLRAEKPTGEAVLAAARLLEAVKQHMADMKYREQEYRRKSEDATLAADRTRAEANALENVIYKASKRL